jgi:hypothetical protein
MLQSGTSWFLCSIPRGGKFRAPLPPSGSDRVLLIVPSEFSGEMVPELKKKSERYELFTNSKNRMALARSLQLKTPMQRFLTLALIFAFGLAANGLQAEGLVTSQSKFYYKDTSGRTTGVRIIRRYWQVPIVHPFAKIDPRIDPKLRRAATIAEERSNAHSRAQCWHYVKEALVASGVISSYPKSAYAYEAGDELTRVYGFKKLSVRDPYAAPLGAVLVYGGRGHVEIRTKDGFVSDYHSKNRCFYPLLAVYGK